MFALGGLRQQAIPVVVRHFASGHLVVAALLDHYAGANVFNGDPGRVVDQESFERFYLSVVVGLPIDESLDEEWCIEFGDVTIAIHVAGHDVFDENGKVPAGG